MRVSLFPVCGVNHPKSDRTVGNFENLDRGSIPLYDRLKLDELGPGFAPSIDNRPVLEVKSVREGRRGKIFPKVKRS